MGAIARAIIEAKIERLIEKREKALQKEDYDRVWILNLEIDKHISKLISYSY